MRIHQKLQINGQIILQNNFTTAGQIINHFYIHIIPRSFDDDKFRVKMPKYQASDEELNEILLKLKF